MQFIAFYLWIVIYLFVYLFIYLFIKQRHPKTCKTVRHGK